MHGKARVAQFDKNPTMMMMHKSKTNTVQRKENAPFIKKNYQVGKV